ncbi:MAG TPA: ABC transporter substrate-binding protein [Gemmatimonadales bacterium]|nr:ABC transporter substrate-binding protein [Gemmatimonadales bacterium]
MAASVTAAACRRNSEPILIGIAGSLTDPVGAPMLRGAELATEEINAHGGIGGRPIELVARDDFADPDSAVFVASDLYKAGVVAVVGHLWSATTLAAAPVYNGGDNPVVAISPSSSSPDVSAAGPYTFRLCPSDLAYGAALARWARDRLGFERGAVLYLDDDYGRGVRRTFVRDFTRMKGEAVSIDPYLGDRPDVGVYLDRVAKMGRAQFLLVAGNESEAEEVLRQSAKRKLTLPVLGGDGLEGIEAAGALAEGVYVSQAYLPSLPNPANRSFVAAYQHKFPKDGLPNQPAAATYDAIYLLRDAIWRAGTSRAAIRAAVAAIGTTAPPFNGVTGRIAFDSLGDVPDAAVHLAVVRHGAMLLAEGR